ncbi:MAG: hypothetical protein LC772_07810 [Chloroflexi bacterium]|nr:hypothetical protein [Chloroflexota bacterium]
MSIAAPEAEKQVSDEAHRLTDQQVSFFETFGYLGLPGLLDDCIQEIVDEFEAVWERRGGGHSGRPHDGAARSCIVPFIDQSARRSVKRPVASG